VLATRLVKVWRAVAVAVTVLALPGGAALAADDPPPFFDPVVTIAPGITREVDVLFDHVRTSSSRLSQPSLRLQYPVRPWLQFALEMPVVALDRDTGPSATAAGDLLLTAQALAWAPSDRPVEIDLGLELTLPTGDPDLLGRSTAVRPFAAAGIKLGRFDVLGNLSYQWIVAGPLASTEVFQTTVAVGYPTRWITPFTELTLTKPVRGPPDLRPQVAVVPGFEIFLPRSITLSIGVQLPLGQARVFDQRVLGFLKLPF
jgi:Putative MetA-pathway of phenol degradation